MQKLYAILSHLITELSHPTRYGTYKLPHYNPRTLSIHLFAFITPFVSHQRGRLLLVAPRPGVISAITSQITTYGFLKYIQYTT